MLDRGVQSRLRAPCLSARRGLLPFLAACTALGTVCLFWGFTVDDAWIVSRVADFGKSHGRFSFNLDGPPSDAVTPLGFAHFLALCARATGADIFHLSRGLGVAAWLGTWVWLGHLLTKGYGTRRALAFVLAPLVCLPGAAWAGAGLETPIIAALFTTGLVGTLGPGQFRAGPLVLGVTAALRPECWPACLVAAGLRAELSIARRVGNLVSCLVAPLLVMAFRLHHFGHPLPLAAIAKPPDPSFGFRYAMGVALLSGAPWLLLGLWRLPRWRSGDTFEAAPHHDSKAPTLLVFSTFLASLFVVGGDWMPLFRLAVPILPWIAFEALRLGRPGLLSWVGGGLAALGSAGLVVAFRADAVRTLEARWAWVHASRGLLEGRENIASVDIGWVGKATAAHITDLSGVSDPQIARLPGGHTSHHVPAALLDQRGVDTWIVRGTLEGSGPASAEAIRATYLVDARLLRSAGTMGFHIKAELPIPRTNTSYFFLVR
jgi:hypothetical protein